MMKCDLCDNEATTHEVVIRGGKKLERHLCEVCAKQHGVDTRPNVPIHELLKNFVLTPAPVAPARALESARTLKCETCGTTFGDFKANSLLGCAGCYASMEASLGPVVERAHEGATHHVGKVPRRALAHSRQGGRPMEALLGSIREREERLNLLRKQLDEAVRNEQFERAARLRDEMRALEGSGGSLA
ncbi:MAG: UvrB/UvrC motif-containing protein [Phycisphaerales bacterium]|nr:UvrB/UvrC motif-containing protein [Phycisphaerales bacterium]